MTRLLVFKILLLLSVASYAQQPSTNYPQVDEYIKHLSERQGIPGVAIAIIKGDSLIYQNTFGYANIEHQVPISNKSIFRLYSLTKPIISVGVFQLIEEGKISLNDSVSKYISDLPDSWKHVKIENILTHSTGLPDMTPIMDYKDLSEEEAKNKVFAQELKFNQGERYDYNQTGFFLLQKVIEKVTGQNLETFILKKQFVDSKNVFFSSDSRDIVLNRATPYFSFEKGTLMIDHPYLQGSYAHATNGLNLTLDEFIKWDKSLKKNKFLNKESMASMWETFPYSKSNKQFAYGWDKHIVNGHTSFGFSGSLCTAYRIFPDDDLSIFFLTNGLSKWYNIDNIVNHIASLVEKDITNKNNLAFETLIKASFEKNNLDFINEYQKIKSNPIFSENNFENHLNDIGYFWLYSLENTEKAIDIFKLNTEENPTSWNTFDSLAEALIKNGDLDKAILNYQMAIKLNTSEEYKTETKVKIEKLRT